MIILVLGLLSLLLFYPRNRAEETVEETESVEQVLEETAEAVDVVPQTSPTDNTNPFEDTYTNPFE